MRNEEKLAELGKTPAEQTERNETNGEAGKILELLGRGNWLWHMSTGGAVIHDENGRETEVRCSSKTVRDLIAAGKIVSVEKRRSAGVEIFKIAK